MDTLFWGLSLGITGKLLLAASVVMVHGKITKEHHIDGIVLMEMRREKYIAVIGVLFMFAGFILELEFYEYILLPFLS